MQTHMFWAYGPFSQLERLCASSFLQQSYDLSIWTYGGLTNAPEGSILRDAREVIPEDRVFTYKNGSFAAYANLFRYTLLNRYGGLYVDTDVVALKAPSAVPQESFLVGERRPFRGAKLLRQLREVLGRPHKTRINNCVIHKRAPQAGDIIDMAQAFASRYPTDLLEWGVTGPQLITTLHEQYPQLSFRVEPPSFANPVNWWECPAPLLTPGGRLPEDAVFLHCYNEMWRRAGIDKNAPFPVGSIMDTLAQRFC